MSGMARGAVLRLAPSPEAMAAAAASEVIALLDSAIGWRGEAHLALSGGRTPAALHRRLASAAFEGWPFVHVWFGDERTVPPDHADSNYRMARETLLDVVPIPATQVHRLAGEDDPASAAAAYHEELARLARRQERDTPTFDVLLLGMGADAHTASLFPGSPLLAADAPHAFAAAVDVPKLSTTRLTITPLTVGAARAVLVLVAGADKHEALTRALGTDPTLGDAPVTLLLDVPGDVAWYVDRAALFGA
jgi:6-phosphogluconolactonase